LLRIWQKIWEKISNNGINSWFLRLLLDMPKYLNLKTLLNYRLLFPVMAVFVLFSACSPERKLATSYAKSKHDIALLIFPTDMVYKDNLNKEGISNTNPSAIDSLLFVNSKFLKRVSDSIFLETYINSLSDELKLYGYKIYFDADSDDFLTNNSSGYIIDIAQLQLEEYLKPVYDEAAYHDSMIYQDFWLNALNLNSWYEISGMNDSQKTKKMLYASETAADYFNGKFKFNLLTEEVTYQYTIDTIALNDVYELAAFAGKKYASYIFDYIMNLEIRKQLPASSQPYKYMHFDRESGRIEPAYDYRFTPLYN
jgi:hypothetical protein